ncbi:IclR family transcriptional regulator [Rhodococcus sp. 15-725-2-2b]|jgi:DNA-binding IclR family transcriptional regulator|nr:IclR family transcriptional regulator [Rhodococcus sp. 06-470-2]OZC64521.1 IclR family transcriptional regulator [Rhodococcus sp. 06-469-3-2]OZC88044.1 IclR family transcriptional regulator [Rhodococcus sp. 06-418-1B]OZD51155.1 IclR family transcriptional regulator [Rhodococcus sp. 06-1477-1A]OZE32148.1 IclR family transcriptional regulator [Rhodococcus sp. 05-2254-5]OZE58109.1 IclR family transcriptional regulator [Rhodococcus sp. 05-2221-1B]OZE59571.1 IclR family transcriptional regulato
MKLFGSYDDYRERWAKTLTAEAQDQKYRAPALAKGLDILELLASTENGLAQAEIGKQLGRTTSEIFRVLMVLRERDYVQVDEADRYRLTTKLFEMAHRTPTIQRLTAIAGSEMQKLANRIGQSIHLCILHSGQLLVVAQVDCPDTNVHTVRLGALIPIDNSASGRVLASQMDPADLEILLTLAGPGDNDQRTRFLADLAQVRGAGYCQGRSLTIEGITNISAPVFDFTGNAVAAMTTPFIHRLTGTENVDPDHARMLLVQTCESLSRRMGAGASAKH